MFEFRPPAVVQADADLTVSLRRGDDAAVRALFGRYGGLVQAIALDAVEGGTGEHARDESAVEPERIVVHTFLQAWRNSEAFAAGENFAPWLANLTRSVATAAGHAVPDGCVDALLADAADWVEPPDGLADRVVAAVAAEAHVDPSEIYTAADLAAASAAGSSRSGLVRAAVLGLVGGLVLLLGVVLGLSALGGSDGGASTTIELRSTGRILDVQGSIRVEPIGSGLSIRLETSPLPDLGGDGFYQTWVTLDDGTTVSAGSFLGGAGDVDISLSAAVAGDQVDQFVVAGVSPDASSGPDTFDESDVIFRAPLP